VDRNPTYKEVLVVPEDPLEIVNGKGIGPLLLVVQRDSQEIVGGKGVVGVFLDIGCKEEVQFFLFPGGKEDFNNLLNNDKP